MAVINGIDISRYQKKVDFNLVTTDQKQIKFCFIKATQGLSYEDPRFKRNWREVQNTDLLYGAYHFFSNKSGKKQAEHFLKVVGHKAGALQPALDLEKKVSKKQQAKFIDRARKFVETIDKELGRKPFIYTARGFWDMYGNPDFSDCPLWVANFTKKSTPKLPKSKWKTYTIWQFSDKGNVLGIGKNPVDLDRFNGDIDLLRKFQLP